MADSNATSSTKPSGLNILQFCITIGKLKHLPRTGWGKFGVANPETVACHMYRMSILAFLLDKSTLDRDRCIRMALVHDMAESIVGDITPTCGVSEEDKHALEKAALEKIILDVPKEIGEEFLSLWNEYEAASTPEAQAVKDLDKFDMIMQAFEYESGMQRPDFLQEFFNSTEGRFKTDLVKGWVQELQKVRDGSTYGDENAK